MQKLDIEKMLFNSVLYNKVYIWARKEPTLIWLLPVQIYLRIV